MGQQHPKEEEDMEEGDSLRTKGVVKTRLRSRLGSPGGCGYGCGCVVVSVGVVV